MPRVAIVAAMEREIKPLVRNWRTGEREHQGKRFRFFEKDQVLAVCGGIGAQAARRAAEAVIALYKPELVYSAGFAGALDESLKAGTVIIARRVVNAGDGSSVDTGIGEKVLVSFNAVGDPAQKKKLAEAFAADAIDMEAAAVAIAAQHHGVGFAAVKAISDECDFKLPAMERFISSDGSFRTVGFAFSILVRPWWWAAAIRLARNSRVAARELCRALQRLAFATSDELPVLGGQFSSR